MKSVVFADARDNIFIFLLMMLSLAYEVVVLIVQYNYTIGPMKEFFTLFSGLPLQILICVDDRHWRPDSRLDRLELAVGYLDGRDWGIPLDHP